MGGPSGGDGGHGGNVIMVADRGINTLDAFRYKREFRAASGTLGGGSKRTGRDGSDLEIQVPVGTVVNLERHGSELKYFGDLTAHGQRLLVAAGGRGGRGNVRFVTSTLREPLLAEDGEPGEQRRFYLELKLIADVGIVGLPNAGKSSLLRAISRSPTKVADYPFTTLEPHLGVVEHRGRTLVAVDIPGLIEGAHSGAGLGHEFLRHVERTRLLVHLIDGGEGNAAERMRTINLELEQFDPALREKPQIVVVNKVDIPEVELLEDEITGELADETGADGDVLFISAAGRTGLEPLKDAMFQALDSSTAQEAEEGESCATGTVEKDEEIPVLRPVAPSLAPALAVRNKEGFLVTHPRAVRLANGSDLGRWKAQVQMRDQLKRMGVTRRLEELGVASGDTVKIGEWEFTWE